MLLVELRIPVEVAPEEGVSVVFAVEEWLPEMVEIVGGKVIGIDIVRRDRLETVTDGAGSLVRLALESVDNAVLDGAVVEMTEPDVTTSEA